jgi:hypothetical protein
VSSSGDATDMEDMKLWRCPEMKRRVHADDRARRIILEAVLVVLKDDTIERIFDKGAEE